jgi:uncharacterized DUF497 family protein
MEECFVLNGISFVWDRAKAHQNLRKHGIPFERAAEAFFDPFLRVVDASSDDEARDAIIGMDEKWNLLFVVHISFESGSVRIISARQATNNERRIYED